MTDLRTRLIAAINRMDGVALTRVAIAAGVIRSRDTSNDAGKPFKRSNLSLDDTGQSHQM